MTNSNRPSLSNATLSVTLHLSLSDRWPNLLCDISFSCCFVTGPWTVPHPSLRVLRRINVFQGPPQPMFWLFAMQSLRDCASGCSPTGPGPSPILPFACCTRPLLLLPTHHHIQIVYHLPQCGSVCMRYKCSTPLRGVLVVLPPPPPCISYALVQATAGVGTVLIWYLI